VEVRLVSLVILAARILLHLVPLATILASIRAPLEVQDQFSVDSRNMVLTEPAELFATIWSTTCAVMISSTMPMTDLLLALLQLPLPLLHLPLLPLLLHLHVPLTLVLLENSAAMTFILALLAMTPVRTRAPTEAKDQCCADSRNTDLMVLVEPFATTWWTTCAVVINCMVPMMLWPPALQPKMC